MPTAAPRRRQRTIIAPRRRRQLDSIIASLLHRLLELAPRPGAIVAVRRWSIAAHVTGAEWTDYVLPRLVDNDWLTIHRGLLTRAGSHPDLRATRARHVDAELDRMLRQGASLGIGIDEIVEALARRRDATLPLTFQDAQGQAASIAIESLAALRVAAGLTQAQLAKRVGVGRTAISALERGALRGRAVHVDLIERVARALGQTVDVAVAIVPQPAAAPLRSRKHKLQRRRYDPPR